MEEIEELHSHLEEEQDFHTAVGRHIGPEAGEAGRIDLEEEDTVAEEVVAHTPAERHMEVDHIDLEVVLVVVRIDLGEAGRIDLEEAAHNLDHREVALVVRRSLVVEGGIGCIQAEENVLEVAAHHNHHMEVVDMPS